MKNLRTEAIVLSLKAIGFMLNQDPRGRNDMFHAAEERLENMDLALDKMAFLLNHEDPEDEHGEKLRNFIRTTG